MKDSDKINKEKIKIRDGGAYAETSGGFFTSLRKRLAFAIASSRLVAAVVPLNFFGRLPSELGAARRFFAPTGPAKPAEELAPGWPAFGWRRGTTSPSTLSYGQSAKVAEGRRLPSAPPPPSSALASIAAAPK